MSDLSATCRNANALGAFSLVDDDKLKDGEDVPMPNTNTLGAAMTQAYVSVGFDTEDSDDNVPFVLNLTRWGFSKVAAANWQSRKDNSASYWVAYVLGAFQGPVDEDTDPDSESVLEGHTRPYGGSVVFIESNRDVAIQDGTAPATEEEDTVVHEVGHAVADSARHPVTGGDAQSIPIGTKSKDGILVTTHDFSVYQAAYLDWIRSTTKPRS